MTVAHRLWLAASLLVLLLSPMRATAQAAQAAPGATPTINAKCPVLTDEEIDPKYTVSWNGVNVGLCCAKCQKKFLANPQSYVANLPPLPAAAPPVAAVAPAAGATPAAPPVQAPATPQADGESAPRELFGRFHVLIVHFPIGLLLAAALAELLSMARGSAGLSAAAHFCANFAAIAAPITALSGLQLADDYVPLPGLEQTVEWHRYGGVTTAVLAVLIALLGWRARRPGGSRGAAQAFRWTLFAAAVIVGITAHFGGELVYGAGYPFE